MATATDVPAAAAAPGATGHPKGSPAERVVMQAQKIGQSLETMYQELHALTGAKSPEASAVRMIQEAVAELAAHVGKGMQDMPMDDTSGAPPAPEPAPADAGPPMGASPFAGAAAGLHQDMMGSVPPGATPLP